MTESCEPGVLYKERRLEATKLAGVTTRRSRTAAETMSAIKPLFRPTGITRLADITDLDRIGIPVTLAVRPNSKTLAVSSGKSLDLLSALVSGAMESLELFHAENSDPPRLFCTYEELVAARLEVPVEYLPVRLGSLFNTRWPETWIKGWDLLSQRQVCVPANTVLMAPQRMSARPSIAAFVTDSNGLASGNNLCEAILSGLYEVIERDSVAIHKYTSSSHGNLVRKIDIATIPFESVQRINWQILNASTQLMIFDCTSSLGIPTYRAMLLDCNTGPASVVEGFGTHLCPELALIRAITEACQGRAVVISGARDDIFSFAIEKLRYSDLPKRFRGLIHQSGAAFTVEGYQAETATLHGDVKVILQALRSAKLEQAIVVELKLFDCEQAFVKVVVPGLEGYPSPGYKPGNRIHEALRTDTNATNGIPLSFRLESLHFPAGGRPR